MKIFIFCGPLAFGKGGMEKVAANLANYLSSQNIVTLGYFSREGQKKPAYEVDPQVMLAPWEFKAEGSRLAYSKRIIESQSDVFIYFGASSQAIQVISLLWKCNIPILMHEGSNPERVITSNWAVPRKISRYEAAWERELIYEHATAVRFTMPEYLNSLPSEMRYKAKAFPNAFPIPENWGQGNLNKRIINIGGLKPNKDIIPLLDVCRKLFDLFPEWSLHVFSAKNKTAEGDKYVKEVEERICKYKLSDNIFIHGEVDCIEEEYLHSDIHIITSFSEGLSNAVAESMTYGVPTIGIRDVPGVDGLVKHGVNGFLVDRGDLKNDLFLYLKKLINDKQLRKKFALQARQDSAMFDPQKVNKEWGSLIQDTVRKKIREKCSEQEKHYQKLRGDFYRKVVKGFGVETGSEEAYRKSLKAQQPNESLLSDKEIKAERGRWIDE